MSMTSSPKTLVYLTAIRKISLLTTELKSLSSDQPDYYERMIANCDAVLAAMDEGIVAMDDDYARQDFMEQRNLVLKDKVNLILEYATSTAARKLN